jgi:hypothetical protein
MGDTSAANYNEAKPIIQDLDRDLSDEEDD